MFKINILLKSINYEIIKTFFGVLIIFLFLVLGSKLVGYFEDAAEGVLNPEIIFSVVALRIPDFVSLLLPLSYFLAVTIVLSRLYSEREMFGFLSVGLSLSNIFKFLLPLTLFLMISVYTLNAFIAPITKEMSKDMLIADSIDELIDSLDEEKINMLDDGKGFISFDEKNKNSTFRNPIFVSLDNNSFFVLLAENMSIINSNSNNYEFIFYEGLMTTNFNSDTNGHIESFFKEFVLPFENKLQNKENLIDEILDYSPSIGKAKLFWDISLPLMILVLLIVALNISIVGPRDGRLKSIMPGVLIYIFYLSFIIMVRDRIETGVQDNILIAMWPHLIVTFIPMLYLLKNKYFKQA